MRNWDKKLDKFLMHESRVVKESSAQIRYNYYEQLRNSYLIPDLQQEEYMPRTEQKRNWRNLKEYF